MKKIVVLLMVSMVMFAGKAQGTAYTLGPGEHRVDLVLSNYDSILIDGGSCETLSLSSADCIAYIVNTSSLGPTSSDGGIWDISGGGQELNILGGEIRKIETSVDLITNISGGYIKELTVKSRSFTNISGGQIDLLRSEQTVPWGWVGVEPEPREYVPFPYVNIICRSNSWDETTNILTGVWEDYSTFNIQLEDVDGFDMAIDNIKFTIVPEPVSILFLGCGTILLSRRK